ncbi:transketolase [Kordiimonas sediminis]|uniref:Transketolase n=1 Tax=Kordiimonas sediminis TaxID=1735581 RepID=A0A919AYF2_9PROT|nr:transketolase C-terminal domain-containing protein [Kordiimonas sediminis]GHF29497.1 transketolase [Kordiimonas sediminis]
MTSLDFWTPGDEVSVRDAFGRILSYMADQRADWVLLDADVAGGTGAKPLVNSHPDRVMQFGIAEQNMMAASAGVADTGLIPVVSTFAAFGCMRAHEQFRTAVAYAGRNVKLCCSHIGLDVGPDGATAQMLEDLATMRAIPGVTVISPADANEFMLAFQAILDHEGPVYMRIGRSPTPVVYDASHRFEIGRAHRIRDGRSVSVFATGVMVARALAAADVLAKDGIDVRVVNVSTIKPIDQQEVVSAAQETAGIVTAEDHNILGGLGGAVAECLAEHSPAPMRFVGVRDTFGKSGEHDELPALFGIDSEAIIKACRELTE